MKIKKFSKKLILNKSTVADLNGNELKKVKGGCYKTDGRSGCTPFPLGCIIPPTIDPITCENC